MNYRFHEIEMNHYFHLPNFGLKAYFNRVRQGNDVEYRTTFAKGESLASVLKDWEKICSRIESNFPGLWDYECEMKEKVGPLSIMKPLSERMGDVTNYYEDSHKPQISFEQQEISAVVEEFSKIRGLRVRSRVETLEDMKLSTNSGNPFFTKRRNVKDETLSAILDYPNQIFKKDGTFGVAAILGWRGQEGGIEPDDVKQRVVWMFPFLVNLLELGMYQPLIKGCQQHSLVPAWNSMDAVDERITRLFDSVESRDVIVCTDFSKFDQHFGQSMQDCAKRILWLLSDHTDKATKDWFENVFPIKYKIPLLYDYGKLVDGLHGMGSGSGGTNADETLAHRALQYEAARSQGARLNLNSMCLGDDGILSYPGIDVDKVIAVYSSHGLDMNPDKQSINSNECTYLRRWHSRSYRIDGKCVGVYSTFRALGRLCEQERYYNPKEWGPKMVALRQLSILENCKFHPLKEEFVKFCMLRDKFRLGMDIPGFLDNVEQLAQEANAAYTDFIGYTKSQQLDGKGGLNDWWIVNYLKSLR